MRQIPDVIIHPRGSISTYRALKQIKELLERVTPEDAAHEDRLNASIDDIDTLFDALKD